MKPSEDAMQDAWVALLEKPGGPSSVENQRSWLYSAARRIEIAGWRARAVRLQAERDYHGLPPHPSYIAMKEANRDKSRRFRMLNPDYYKGRIKPKKPLVYGPPPPRYSKMPSGNICVQPGRPRVRKI